jgi:hypothetical protein
VIARTIIAGHELLVQPGEAANGAAVPRCFSLMAGAGFDAKVVAASARRSSGAGAAPPMSGAR